MDIKQMLDNLANHQSHVDLLEMQKRELLDQVKVPQEVLSAQEAANARRASVEAELMRTTNNLNQQRNILLAEIVDPQLPPEYMAAMKEAQEKRQKINDEFSQKIEAEARAAHAKKLAIDEELQNSISDVYAQVEQRRVEIQAEFSGQAEAAKKNIEKLTKEIKDAVIKAKDSFKGTSLHAIYAKGRTTWKTDLLDDVYFKVVKVKNQLYELATQYPDLVGISTDVLSSIELMEKARKVGDPSVSIKALK